MHRETGDPPLYRAAILTAAGIIFSGPLGLLGVMLIHGQPAWRNAQTFIDNYHPVQTVPYLFGFLLISGLVLFVSRCAVLFFDEERHRAYTLVVFGAVFASMIVINYTIQLVYVPWLVREQNDAVAYFTMTNPGSLSWGFEMVGYGVVGVATFIIAPRFRGNGRRRWIRWLLVANGVVSVAGAVITAMNLSWVQTPTGLVSFVGWNLLLLAAMILVAREVRGGSAVQRIGNVHS